MTYERFHDRYDSEADPGYYPEYDPDDEEINKPYLLLGEKGLAIVERTIQRLPLKIEPQHSMGLSIRSLDWTTKLAKSGLDEIDIVTPGNIIGFRIKLPIIDAAAGKMDPEPWAKEYSKRLKEDRQHTIFPLPHEATQICFDIEKRSGVEDFKVLGMQSVVLFDTITNAFGLGGTVIAPDWERRALYPFPSSIYPSKVSDDDARIAFKSVKKFIDIPPSVDPFA